MRHQVRSPGLFGNLIYLSQQWCTACTRYSRGLSHVRQRAARTLGAWIEAGLAGALGGESEEFVDADPDTRARSTSRLKGGCSDDDAAAGADLVGELLLGVAGGLAQCGEARPEPGGGGGGDGEEG